MEYFLHLYSILIKNIYFFKRSHLEVENLEVKISLEELALTKLKCGDVAVILESYFTLINKIQV
jgi:hypothetical protein